MNEASASVGDRDSTRSWNAKHLQGSICKANRTQSVCRAKCLLGQWIVERLRRHWNAKRLQGSICKANETQNVCKANRTQNFCEATGRQNFCEVNQDSVVIPSAWYGNRKSRRRNCGHNCGYVKKFVAFPCCVRKRRPRSCSVVGRGLWVCSFHEYYFAVPLAMLHRHQTLPWQCASPEFQPSINEM
jgi:hypothetical protein